MCILALGSVDEFNKIKAFVLALISLDQQTVKEILRHQVFCFVVGRITAKLDHIQELIRSHALHC